MSQHILVTGTNSGFGRLITLTLAKKGHTVFATMRDTAGRNAKAAEALVKEGGEKVHIIEMSMTDDASVEKGVGEALAKGGHLDVLVNNAGYSMLGLEETLTSAQLLHQYDVNVVGPHRTMRAVLPSMRARGRGLIVQIGSGLGRITFPVMGAYGSTKFALEALMDAYRYELKGVGVEVTLVQPGAYPTEFAKNIVIGAEQQRAEGYGPMAGALQMMNGAFEQMFSGPTAPNPQDVADAIDHLVDLPVGTRPARVPVDKMMAALYEELNKAHADAQKTALSGMGMGPLAD